MHTVIVGEHQNEAFESTDPTGYWSGDVNGSSEAEGPCSFMKSEGKNKCSWFYSLPHIEHSALFNINIFQLPFVDLVD